MEKRDSDGTEIYACGGKNIMEPARIKYMYPSPICYQTLNVKNNNKEFSPIYISLILIQVKVII